MITQTLETLLPHNIDNLNKIAKLSGLAMNLRLLMVCLILLPFVVMAYKKTSFTDTDYTGLRVYHHMKNMVEHIEKVGLNQWEHPPIADHTFFVITPALDHIYSKAMLDLSNGPVILETPSRDNRYASVHIVDSEHFTLYAKTSPQNGGRYLITRRGANYSLPEEKFTDIIEANEDLTFLFIRTQTFEYRDDGYADKNRRKLKLNPLVKAAPLDLPDRKDPKEVIAFAMSINDGWDETASSMQKAAETFTLERYKETVSHIENLLVQGVITSNAHGFEAPNHPDADGNNLTRAAITHIGHLGFPAYHAYYENIPVTREGIPLNGSTPFVFTMPHNLDLDYFWSVTRYSSKTRLPLDPSKIGGSNRQVFAAGNTEPDKNGNVTITFSSTDPKDGTYWMPVVDGEQYYFVVRYYGPRKGLAGKTAASIIFGGTPLEEKFAPKSTF